MPSHSSCTDVEARAANHLNPVRALWARQHIRDKVGSADAHTLTPSQRKNRERSIPVNVRHGKKS